VGSGAPFLNRAAAAREAAPGGGGSAISARTRSSAGVDV